MCFAVSSVCCASAKDYCVSVSKNLSMLCDVSGENIVINEPTPADIETRISRLNNLEHTVVILTISDLGMLSVYGGNQNWVVVSFHGLGKGDAYRSGKAINETAEVPYKEIDISISGDVNPVSTQFTLPNNTAIEIAIYFAQHHTMPKNIRWKGNMDGLVSAS